MPYINFNDDKERRYVHEVGRKRKIPRSVIREWARDDVMQNKPCFSCPSCHVNYGMRFGRIAVKGSFGEQTHYCLDCIEEYPDIHKL